MDGIGGGEDPEYRSHRAFFQNGKEAYCIFIPKSYADKSIVLTMFERWREIDYIIGEKISFVFRLENSVGADDTVPIEELMLNVPAGLARKKHAATLAEDFMRAESAEKIRRLYDVSRDDLPAICVVFKALPDRINIYRLSKTVTFDEIYKWLEEVSSIIEEEERVAREDTWQKVQPLVFAQADRLTLQLRQKAEEFEKLETQISGTLVFLARQFKKGTDARTLLPAIKCSNTLMLENFEAVITRYFPGELIDLNTKDRCDRAIKEIRNKVPIYRMLRTDLLIALAEIENSDRLLKEDPAIASVEKIIKKIENLSLQNVKAKERLISVQNSYTRVSQVLNSVAKITRKAAPLVALYHKIVHGIS